MPCEPRLHRESNLWSFTEGLLPTYWLHCACQGARCRSRVAWSIRALQLKAGFVKVHVEFSPYG